MIGTTVGRFRIVSKLGEGGMGTVWKAEDPRLSRTIALKFLPESLMDSPEARRRFEREARSTSLLDHPNIATLYDLGELDGVPWIAVAYVDGETVSQILANGKMEPLEATRILTCAAAAIEHAHSRGVVHRDITSRNIMIAADGRVFVIDFGLSLRKDTGRITTSNVAMGTAAYMAPEVASGDQADTRSDIYGLGVVYYEMTTGELPFKGDRPLALLYSVVNETPTSPGQLGVPAPIERVILKAMARDPGHRYQTAADLLLDLRRCKESVERGAAQKRRAASDPKAPATSAAAAPASTRARPRKPKGVPALPCIAVLPFQDLESSGAESTAADSFARGIAEILSAALARVPRIHVVPPSSAVLAPTIAVDLKKAARYLGASLVLTGTVRRSGDRLRIGYSLLDPAKGNQIAGDNLEGLAEELFELEDRLLSRVLRALQLDLGADSGPALAHPGSKPGIDRTEFVQALGYLQRFDDEASIDRALELLENRSRMEGDTAIVQSTLGRAYLLKYVRARDTEWVRKAQECCRRALALEPHSFDVLLTLGRLHVQTGHYDDAIEALGHSLKTRPGDAGALLYLASAFQGLANFELAEQACMDAISSRPDYWYAHDRLGLLYYAQGRLEDAANAWKMVTRLLPEGAIGFTHLGAAYFQSGKLEEARQCYQRSLEMEQSSTTYTSLGTVNFYLGDFPEAAILCQKAVDIHPMDPRAWGNLGDVQRWIPELSAQSRSALEKAVVLGRAELQANPVDAEGWANLAFWLAKLGRTAESLESISRATSISPDNATCIGLGVTVYHLAGMRGKAIEYLERALERGAGFLASARDPELRELWQDERALKLNRTGA